MREEITVGGFEFAGEDDARIAAQEKKRIEYLEKHMDYSTPGNVLMVYRKAIAERIFKTPVGYLYLKQMQEYLQQQTEISKEDIPPIKLYVSFEPKIRKRPQPARRRVINPEEAKQKKADRLLISVIVNIILAVAVAAMFGITLNSPNPNVLNYEKAVVNQYASWEQQLTERENVVRDKEKALNIQQQ